MSCRTAEAHRRYFPLHPPELPPWARLRFGWRLRRRDAAEFCRSVARAAVAQGAPCIYHSGPKYTRSRVCHQCAMGVCNTCVAQGAQHDLNGAGICPTCDDDSQVDCFICERVVPTVLCGCPRDHLICEDCDALFAPGPGRRRCALTAPEEPASAPAGARGAVTKRAGGGAPGAVARPMKRSRSI